MGWGHPAKYRSYQQKECKVIELVEDATKKMGDLSQQVCHDTEQSLLVIITLAQAVSEFIIKK